MIEDQVRDLKDMRLTADNLRKRLHLEKIQFTSKHGKGDGEVVAIYKTHCHPTCSLKDVKEDVVADPGLINCEAFFGNVKVQVKDTEIQRQLQANTDDVTLRQAGMEKVRLLISEFGAEHREIQEAVPTLNPHLSLGLRP
ncbi:hypothetical protein QQX98_011273 [Neonectria punicea]|uniref:DUF8206 domain-containing protein n=1 Tax=Neonectria punicea TaxID=979145 RepID=A0ABR1GML1_9HYPO